VTEPCSAERPDHGFRRKGDPHAHTKSRLLLESPPSRETAGTRSSEDHPRRICPRPVSNPGSLGHPNPHPISRDDTEPHKDLEVGRMDEEETHFWSDIVSKR
jgi:hypothetical protein